MGVEIEPEDITKLIDGIYKNLVDKFNPNATQLIAAGKGYLKALQGLTAASNLFNDSLSKIATNAQESLSSDIGDALFSLVNIQKTIQEHQVNVLKAFYADLLMPLETNLEKDTKVIQSEQKKFLQQHKLILENYCKAVTALKKQRKKKRSSGLSDKELKILQNVEEEKLKLKHFCNISFKSVVLQERRRYGFILERQCSIAKHYIVYHETGKKLFEDHLEDLVCVAGTRESFGQNLDNHLKKKIDELKGLDNMNLRKTRSMDMASDYWKSNNERAELSQNTLPRTKSEHNLTTTNSSTDDETAAKELEIVTTVFPYEESGKNQLGFEKGDRIILIGNSANGWKFGKNIRTKMLGWFPETYIEYEHTDVNISSNDRSFTSTLKGNRDLEEATNSRIFGDTLVLQNAKYFQNISSSGLRTSPPSVLPPPVPNISQYQLNSNQIYNHPLDPYILEKNTSTFNTFKGNKLGKNTETGLITSNDSNFCPPPQPEIDYSDEEKSIRTTLRKKNFEVETSIKPISLESINSNIKFDKNKKDNFIKRTKSFWRSKKVEDPLTDTSLWKHKDIINKSIPSNNTSNNIGVIANKVETVDRRRQKSVQKSTNQMAHKLQNLNKTNNNEKKRNTNNNNVGNKFNNNTKQKYISSNDNDSDITVKVLDAQSFDDSGGINHRKTVTRREILKQYYSSDSDSEKMSRTSDQYDCIVIDDHLVRSKFEFKSFPSNNNKDKSFNTNNNNNNNAITSDIAVNGTLLPRTKLNKGTKSNITKKNDDFNSDNNIQYVDGSLSKAYGPWYNLWEEQNANINSLNNP